MKYVISFSVAILLTALSYFLGSHFIANGMAIWQALIIGTTVVALGAITEALGAPRTSNALDIRSKVSTFRLVNPVSILPIVDFGSSDRSASF